MANIVYTYNMQADPGDKFVGDGRQLRFTGEGYIMNQNKKKSLPVIVKHLDFNNTAWLDVFFRRFENQTGQRENVDELLYRYTGSGGEAGFFTGALKIDNRFWFLIWKNHILEAVDTVMNVIGDSAFEHLPGVCDRYLAWTIADEKTGNIVLLLSTILHEQGRKTKKVDTSVFDKKGFIRKVSEEDFTGLLLFQENTGRIYYGFYTGQPLLIFQSHQSDLSIDENTTPDSLLGEKKLSMEVLPSRFDPLDSGYRYTYNDSWILAARLPEECSHLKMIENDEPACDFSDLNPLIQSLPLYPKTGKNTWLSFGKQTLSAENIFKQGFEYRFSQWLLYDLFNKIIASGNKESLKYICSWVPETDKIKLFQPVENEKGRARFFNIVTVDKSDKILHMVYRTYTGEARQLRNFSDDMVSVKMRFLKSGDIGGVFYVSSAPYTREALELFYELTGERKKKLGIGLLDSLTGYRGFVRVGKNRGFHLCLVQEEEDGFTLIKPEI